MRLFGGHAGVHGTHGAPELDINGLKWAIKSTARTLREPPTLEMWQQHLDGERPLGIVPIREDNTCLWGSIDVDQYDISLVELVSKVYKSKMPVLPARSKSGGLHLFSFYKEPVDCAVSQAMQRDMAATLGLAGSEIFPKQTKVLTERGDMGNWMVMPYFGGDFDGKLQRQVGLKKTGAEMTASEFLAEAERLALGPDELVVRREKKSRPKSPFDDGPPCLQHMATKGFPDGSRNNALFMIGLYHKKASGGNLRDRLHESNRLFMQPPLNHDEVETVIRQLEKRDYEYTCKTEPMASHCDSGLCRARRFGVGKAGEFPTITGMTKLDIPDEPIWFIDVGDLHVEMNTAELQNFQLFQRVCMKANRTFRQIKQADWIALVAEAMEQHLEIIDAPPDVGAPAQFKELLSEWLTNRMRGEHKNDLLAGKPWQDSEGYHWFRLGDLEKYLKREGLRDIGRGEISQRIRKLGGDRKYLNNVKGHGLSAWYVHADALEAAVELDKRKVPDDPI